MGITHFLFDGSKQTKITATQITKFLRTTFPEIHLQTDGRQHQHTSTRMHYYTTTLTYYTSTPVHLYTSTPAHQYTSTPVHQYTAIVRLAGQFQKAKKIKPEFPKRLCRKPYAMKHRKQQQPFVYQKCHL